MRKTTVDPALHTYAANYRLTPGEYLTLLDYLWQDRTNQITFFTTLVKDYLASKETSNVQPSL